MTAIWNGQSWDPMDSPVMLGTNVNSDADNYNTYQLSKTVGFNDDHIQSGLLRILIQTDGETEGVLDLYHVLDYAYLEVTYDPTS